MTVKEKNTSNSWVDPDDAPELTDEMLARATLCIGGREVSAEEFKAAAKKALGGRPRVAERLSLE